MNLCGRQCVERLMRWVRSHIDEDDTVASLERKRMQQAGRQEYEAALKKMDQALNGVSKAAKKGA